MGAAADFSEIPAFQVHMPGEQQVPFVFNSPHSGRHYPSRFLSMSRLDAATIRRSEDCYVDELFAAAAGVGAPFLTANFPRAYLDVNREPWELDPRMFSEPVPSFANIRSPRVAGGLGTIPKLVGEGYDIYEERLPLAEALSRIEHIYKPYHACLAELLSRTRAIFGYAILVDCHSMPANIRVGDGQGRPDFIVGDRFGSSAAAALSQHAISLLTAQGYRVANNKPYAGGFITEHYGRPAEHLHAVQVEVNRGLYMDERTLQRTDGFNRLAADLAEFVRALTASPDRHLPTMPMAAE
ncbi:N-formylglutamate amidohydrolase [Chelativorans sp. M5D2P16]|uniref:N-formylglutamate amidohydrolase n=1 Tax=Chelativorans sp. M5D2P16 TaxID=3095678 RepID=UPI002ACAD6B8|nr:N-formylglutamate amidohydrolase [Chelativorans sp. M5D2P16]MDZ5697541.1 N-formylglutamate amidohydrolase [Chelativorans sp. M5D2P16]